MNTITLEEALLSLMACASVETEDGYTVTAVAAVKTLKDDTDETLCLHFAWVGDSGLLSEAQFSEGCNKDVTVEGSAMTLVDTEGSEMTVYLLAPYDIVAGIEERLDKLKKELKKEHNRKLLCK